MARSRLISKVCSSILMLTGPHQTSSLLDSSKTTRLSLGLRPVFLPEKLMRAPVEEMMAPSLRIASSYNWATAALRLRWTLDMSKPAWEKYSRSWPRTMEASELSATKCETKHVRACACACACACAFASQGQVTDVTVQNVTIPRQEGRPRRARWKGHGPWCTNLALVFGSRGLMGTNGD